MVAVLYYRNQAPPVSFLSFGSRVFPGIELPDIQLNGVIPNASNASQFVLNIPGNVIDPRMNPPLPSLQLQFDDLCESISEFLIILFFGSLK
jgi:hypothetical protein